MNLTFKASTHKVRTLNPDFTYGSTTIRARPFVTNCRLRVTDRHSIPGSRIDLAAIGAACVAIRGPQTVITAITVPAIQTSGKVRELGSVDLPL